MAENLAIDPELIVYIRRRPNEFNFAVLCVDSGLGGRITTERDIPRVPHLRPYFTPVVYRAIGRLLSKSSEAFSYLSREMQAMPLDLKRLTFKSTMDSMLKLYLQECYRGGDLLGVVVPKMVCLSDVAFKHDVTDSPYYTMGCILHIIKEWDRRGTLDWDAVAREAELIMA